MKHSKLFITAAVALIAAATADAARVDMKDPRRALALDDNLRIDAQLTQDVIGSGTSVNITFQVQNNTAAPVAIAEKVCESSYDADTQTITLSIGSEIPSGPTMPHLSVIKSGQTRVFTTGATVHVALPAVRSPFIAYPRYVQVKVNVLRDIAPFSELIEQQAGVQPPLSDSLFETWVENNDAIFLNAIPVRWRSGRGPADQNGADMGSPANLRGGGTF